MTTSSDQKTSCTAIIYCFMVIGVVALTALMAGVPPVSRDALIHHLAIPKLYLRHGSMFEIPNLAFSYYPMNLDLLYLIPLYFKNDILPKFIHFAFALITALMIFRYLRRRINTEYALLGSLFFLSIPVIVCQSTTVYVDLGLVCFLFAALMYLLDWIEFGFKTQYLVISAVFCGLAVGTKYNGLIGLCLLGLFVPFIYARSGSPSYAIRAVMNFALYIIIALIIFSPWMIRNFSWTGNPVYPLYNSIFNPEIVSADSTSDNVLMSHSRMSHVKIRRDLYGESGWEIALIPIRVFFQGKDNDPKYFDGKANPFLLLLPIFAFFGMKNERRCEKTEKMVMFFFSTLFLLIAYMQTVIRIRYFAPILPPLVILSMFGLYNIQTKLLGTNRRISIFSKKVIVFCIIFVMLGLNATYMVSRFNYVQPIGYIMGDVSRDEYIQKFRPEYAAIQYANRHLEKESKILGIFIGNRGYYSDINIEFTLNMLQKFAAASNSPKQISEKLWGKNFSHLLINFELFNQSVKKDYSFHEKLMLKEFFKSYTVTEFSKDGYGLLRVI
ncbi:MAG: glycosyltransferase family 39 protein [Desulfobacteraceae bacterium]|nr:glycosyltransferase family 39 protein [Desulfobacteraceae bacterium]MBC2756904.1 glycosyltransferase family 39 protein [Desulfobacteraceae bacterium]